MKVYGALEVAQIEWFLSSALPSAASYIYRVVYASDTKQILVSDGTTWRPTSVTAYTSGTLPAAASSNQYLVAFLTDTLQIKVSNGSVWTTVGARLDTYTSGTLPAAASYANQIVWVSDLQQVQVSNGSAWVAVGSKAGTKNYFAVNNLNYDFETNSVTNWSKASSTLDSITKLPNQAAGSWGAGSGTLAISAIGGGNQLAGSYSMSIADSAATTAGNMVVSAAITLDKEAQASVQTFSFFYRVASGASTANFSGTSSNSVGVAVYVVDGTFAGTWIQPAGVFNLVQTTGVGKCSGTFQVPIDATQVRLAIYFPNATTGALTLYVDDFVLGPQVVQYGAPVTDWISYTPTFTNLTVSSTEIQYRRVGDHLQIRGKFTCSTASAAEARMSLPLGLTSSGTDKIPTIQVVGQMYLTAASNQFVVLEEPSVTYLTFGLQNATTNPLTKQNANTIFAAGVVFNIIAETPITGWSSSVSMSSDTDTRVVAASYYFNNVGITGGSDLATIWTTIFDTHGAFTNSNGRYTAPVSGFYRVSASGLRTTGTGATITLYKNGGVYNGMFAFAIANGICSGSTNIQLNAGEYLTFRSDAAFTANLLISIERVSGPSVVAATETVAVRYKNTAGTSIALGSGMSSVPFATKVYDTHGAWSGTSFTAPVSGKYQVNCHVYYASASWSISAKSIQLVKSGSSSITEFLIIYTNAAAYTSSLGLSGSATIDLLAGDTLSITLQHNEGTARLLDTIDGVNILSITRIGN